MGIIFKLVAKSTIGKLGKGMNVEIYKNNSSSLSPKEVAGAFNEKYNSEVHESQCGLGNFKIEKIEDNRFFYGRLNNNFLFWALQSNQTICQALAYMTTFKNYENLNVVPKPHSIEIYNNDIIISIILYVGFENNEYLENVNKSNYQIVSLHRTELIEFKEFSSRIKFIEPAALFHTSLSFSNENFCNNLKAILFYK